MKRWIQTRAKRFHRSPASMRRFYDRIHPMYGIVERHLENDYDDILDAFRNDVTLRLDDTVLEYCCGSGLLTLKLAAQVGRVVARDISPRMLHRARRRANGDGHNVSFEQANVLTITDDTDAFDLAVISFGLHLFSPDDQLDILDQLLRVARREVIIIDHLPSWEFRVALIEWWEGSHYNQFINTDWRSVADRLDAAFHREVIGGCQVQRWTPRRIVQ